MKFSLLLLLLLFIQFVGCSHYGSIGSDSVIIKFPIKLSTNQLYHLSQNWSIDSTFAGDDHGFAFILQNDSVNFLKINELTFIGLYKAKLTFYVDGWCEKIDNNYFFYSIDLEVLDGSSETIYDSLRLQPILLVLGDYNGTEHLYDMDNNLRYSIDVKAGWFRFQGLEHLRDTNQSDYRQWLKSKKSKSL